MKINEIKKSRINEIDFKNLPFGRVFSDHMFICNYNGNEWNNARILPYGEIPVKPSIQVLHYGQSVFEGMKAFKNSNDEILFFRRIDNFKRLNNSANRLSIPKIPNEIFMKGLDNLLTLDSNWVKNEEGFSLYIRPIVFASSECIRASSSQEFMFIIITSPTKSYYTGDVNVLIEEKYTRATKGGVGFAKAAGNYASSFFPTIEANRNGFTQLIWTDGISHEYIEESGTMNIWFRINDKLITPELNDSILNGITRDSIIKIANNIGIKVIEKKIKVSDLLDYMNKNELIEAFGTGTAVVVKPIQSITYRTKKYILPKIENSYANKLEIILQGIQKGELDDIFNWTTKLKTY